MPTIRFRPKRAWLLPIYAALLGTLYLLVYTPIIADYHYLKHKRAFNAGKLEEAQKHIQKAILLDPHNTTFLFYAAQELGAVKGMRLLEDSIRFYNGDIVPWAQWHSHGVFMLQRGQVMDARESLQKALWYNPEYTRARKKLAEVDKLIEENDRVMIRFR